MTLDGARELLELDDITVEPACQWLTFRRCQLIGTDEAPVFRLTVVHEELLDLGHHAQRWAA